MKENSLKKNSLVNLIKTVLGLIFPLITFPYASRVLGVSNIGRVNFANSTINYFVLLAGLGISNYAIREGAKIRDDPSAINKFCTEMLLINVMSTTISYLGVFTLLKIPAFQSYQHLLLLFSTTILFNIIGVSWLFYIYEEFVYITVRTILFQIISLVLLLLCVRHNSDIMIYAGILVFSSVGSNIFNIFHSRKYVKFFPKLDFKYYTLGTHLKPIFIIFGISIASTIYLNLDMTMLGLQAGDYEVGLYTAATKISGMASTVISSVCAVFLPRLSYYLKMGKKNDFRFVVDTAFYYILGLTIPAATGIFLLSREIILLFSGAAFLEAVPAMMIKAPNIILSVLNGFIAVQLFVPLNKEKASLYATISGAVVNGLLNYILIPHWGAVGAAIATICAEGCVLFICLIYLRNLYPVRHLLTETWKYMMGSLGILGIGLILRTLITTLWLRTFLTVLLGVGVYFVVLYSLKSLLVVEIKKYVEKRGNMR